MPLPGAVPVPVLLPPVLEPDPMLPVPVPLEVPPAAPELSSFRQRSLSGPVSNWQRALPVLAPVEAEPLVLLSVVVLPPTLLPVLLLLPVLPLGAGVWAAADIAKSAAAVAETNSFKVMNLLLW
ncbi:MAG TPA: hypothetical protein VF936_19140 [Burkholderiales bacterium]